MSWHHAKYRGRSIGRVLHALEVYTNSRIAEVAQVGDGKIVFAQKPFATYEWEDEDTPVLTFDKMIRSETYERNQYIHKPFLDNFYVSSGLNYAIQQLREDLSIEDANCLLFRRDYCKNSIIPESLQVKIIKSMKTTLEQYLKFVEEKEIVEKHWLHFGLCAVYGLELNKEDSYKKGDRVVLLRDNGPTMTVGNVYKVTEANQSSHIRTTTDRPNIESHCPYETYFKKVK